MITINKHKIGDVERQALTACDRFWVLLEDFKKKNKIKSYAVTQLLFCDDFFQGKMQTGVFQRSLNMWGSHHNYESLYSSTQNIE